MKEAVPKAALFRVRVIGLLLLFTGTDCAFGRELAQLDSLKALATSLLKRNDLGSVEA